MKLDIVFVTYNSSHWINNCIDSISASDYDLKNVSLYFCDNNSTDNTIYMLNNKKNELGDLYENFQIIQSAKNIGFGRGNNKAAKLGSNKYILFLNIDTEIRKDTLSKLSKEIENSDKNIGAWELSQAPYEHPKYYDPITGLTSWASGACIVIKRDVFKKVGGFDRWIFMYAEDVEISWHIRKKGYDIKYLPNVTITHYSYSKPNEFKSNQYIYSIINNLYLRYKYGNIKNMVRGNMNVGKKFLRNYLQPIISEEEEVKIRKIIKKEYIKLQFKAIFLMIYNLFSRRFTKFKPRFIHFDYETVKMGPFYVTYNLPIDGPLVSIVIRTCGRVSVLRETLISLRNQTYKNIEVVIVEDGPNTSETIINDEFQDLNISYYSLGVNQGRSKAGNYGMKKAKGKYINFLDDDDLFYPDHVQVLVNELENCDSQIAYTTAFETPIIVHNKDPYHYTVKFKAIVHSGEFNKIKLFSRNITPIQAVMFDKNVFLDCGGFDETIDALEDWDLWIRFAMKYNWHYVEKTTSLYRVPFQSHISKEREEFLNSTLKYVVNKNSSDIIETNMREVYRAFHEGDLDG